MNITTLLFLASIAISKGSALRKVDGDNAVGGNMKRPSLDEVEIYLKSIGYSLQDLCHGPMDNHGHRDDEIESFISNTYGYNLNSGRFLAEEGKGEVGEEEEEEDDEDGEGGPHDKWFYIINGGMAFMCVTVAALAAGLTMGLASQEMIDLKIKEVAGNPVEKKHAKALIPLLQDHHRLLVTLLLINAMANEALPLFLDKVVSPLAAVILSVTLVLFFGEIIPSAIFSGSNKLAITSALAPLIRVILFLLYPLAKPIGKILDAVLHDEEDDGFMLQKYDRKELSALVRLQYEERTASKMKKKLARSMIGNSGGGGGGIDHSPHKNSADGASMRFIKAIDTVTMVEGALEMQSKTVASAMIKIDDVFAIPYDAVLNEARILEIYRMGFSRVPVYDKQRTNIVGIFKTRQLMVVNTGEMRLLSNLPLIKPHCVAPNTNMQSLVNLLQTGTTAGRGGHMAIVCQEPLTAIEAFDNDEPIPESAGVLGIVTLENCVEVLIQEDIYDEYDQAEKLMRKRAKWAIGKWKKFVKKRKGEAAPAAIFESSSADADETTRLLPTALAAGNGSLEKIEDGDEISYDESEDNLSKNGISDDEAEDSLPKNEIPDDESEDYFVQNVV